MSVARCRRASARLLPLAPRRWRRARAVGMHSDAPWPASGTGSCVRYDAGPAPAEPGGPVAKYPFLSDEWLAEVHRIVAEHDPDVPSHASVTLNLVVTDTPFGEDRLLHMGARDGKGDFGPGHLGDADVTFTTDYATAREIFVSGN